MGEQFQRMKKRSARVAPLPSYNVSELNSPVPDGKFFFSYISNPRQGFTLLLLCSMRSNVNVCVYV